ncbi:MAG: 30S ribosomal protein S12 methylthiotransferase RimO [Eubacteriaceae bacterium]|nr:30S ribosomal protein S12 methylthiotransferase RimO [Eubacteriaceae bacterium]
MTKSFYIISLGCAKNLTDSESMAYLLENEGYILTDKIQDAQIILINTCAFIQDAKEEAVREILKAAQIKELNNDAKLIVAGCLAQRYADELKDEIPEIDAFVGTGKYADIIKAVKQAEAGNKTCFTQDIDCDIKETQRKIFTKKPVAYLKISEGCARNCTYCVIPKLRGKYRSRKLEDIIKEAKNLANDGYNEIILVAQDVTLYGIDLYKSKKLVALLTELNNIENIKRLRLMYAYPEGLDDDIINCFTKLDKLQKYIDIPIQHINNQILKSMGRSTSKENIIALYNKLKSAVPEIAIRTTFIVGFPGETDEQFGEITDFINNYPFDKVGVFKYSQEEGTPAAQMTDQIKKQVKTKRYNTLMRHQQKISRGINNSYIGLNTEVLIYDKIESNIYLGRTYRDAPDIDGGVIIASDEELIIGKYYNCIITGADEYDLQGKVIKDEFSQ